MLNISGAFKTSVSFYFLFNKKRCGEGYRIHILEEKKETFLDSIEEINLKRCKQILIDINCPHLLHKY